MLEFRNLFKVGTYRGPENEADPGIPEYDTSPLFVEDVSVGIDSASSLVAELSVPGLKAGSDHAPAVGIERQKGQWVIYLRRHGAGDEDLVIQMPDDKGSPIIVERNPLLRDVEIRV